MADHTKIEWTDATWNPVTGCSVVSPGCTHCYAMKLAGTRLAQHPSRAGLTRETKAGPVWNGTVRFNEDWLMQPLTWKRPRMVFVCAHGDLFHEDVPDAWIDRVFAVMALAPQHTFQVLTKRSARMRAYFDPFGSAQSMTDRIKVAMWDMSQRRTDHFHGGWPLRNVWLGVSAEDQKRADERIPDLLATPAAIRFVSAEPLLGAIDFTAIEVMNGDGVMDALKPTAWLDEIDQWRGTSPTWEEEFLDWYSLTDMPTGTMHPPLDWIIVGGESGPNARPMHPAWARSIRGQCAAAGTAFFFKQWGAWAPLAKAMPVDEAGGRTCSVAWPDGTIGPGSATERGGRGTSLYIATKKLAGRLLDGVEHNAMPRAAA